MRKHRKTRPASDDPIENLEARVAEAVMERTNMTGRLLQQLALTVVANERAQRRFRIAVLIRLSKIETIAKMVHGAQIALAHDAKPCFEEKARSHAKSAEEFISRHSKEMLLEMVSYVYDDPETAKTQGERRRKQSR